MVVLQNRGFSLRSGQEHVLFVCVKQEGSRQIWKPSSTNSNPSSSLRGTFLDKRRLPFSGREVVVYAFFRFVFGHLTRGAPAQ